MCSVAGISCGSKSDVSKMLNAMKHRSPDDMGIYHDKDLSLGMGRLSIIDLKSKNLCPYENSRVVLSFNGEIYNYKDLRKDLQSQGYKFKTNSDTEVLAIAWEKWGIRVFNKLKGMFSFAIYEKKTKNLYLARDIAGEKPLYYTFKNNNIFFSSEVKALTKILRFKKQNNKFFKTFQHCLKETLWKNVYQLQPATYLKFNVKTKKKNIFEYWQIKRRKIQSKTINEEFEELLKKSINLTTQADVDYGLYFSKGVDSSLLAAMHNFKKKFYFNDHLNYKKDFLKNIRKIAYHLDFPVGSFSSYPLWCLAKKAKENNVKVILSGEGADEVFAGYSRYMPFYLQWKLDNKFPSYKNLFNKVQFSYIEGYTNLTKRNNDYIDYLNDFMKKLLNSYFEIFDDPVTSISYFDFKIIMPSLLQMGDRMSSAFGIENRCPFLDKDIIEFGFNLDIDQKINFLNQKIIFKKLLKKKNYKFKNFEKKGLTIKYNKWFDIKGWDRSSYFNLLVKNWKSAYNINNS